MPETSDDRQRIISRIAATARALKKEIEQYKYMDDDEQRGIGDVLVENYAGLVASATKIIDDPYLQSLTPRMPEGASDRQKIASVSISVTLFLAFLEAEAGVDPGAQSSKGGGKFYINIPPFADWEAVTETLEKAAQTIEKAFGGEAGKQAAESIRNAFRGRKEES